MDLKCLLLIPQLEVSHYRICLFDDTRFAVNITLSINESWYLSKNLPLSFDKDLVQYDPSQLPQ